MAWATTEDGLRFGLDFLKRYHPLRRGTYAGNQTCKWSRGGYVHSSIRYDLVLLGDEPFIRLYYTHKKETEVNYKIRMVVTTPHYGGERWWFVCPHTGKRCSVLYSPAGQPYFASRGAFGLKYESQKEDARNRAMRRYQVKADKYGAEWGEPWFPKPKGMQLKTYQRRLAELGHLNDRVDGHFLAWGLKYCGIDADSPEDIMRRLDERTGS